MATASDGSTAKSLKIGLVNSLDKYLTAEPYGHKVNVTGTGLRQKQAWFVELDPNRNDVIYLKSFLGRYLTSDKIGNISCEQEDRNEEGQFAVEYFKDGSGRWSLRHILYKYYLAGNEQDIHCLAKSASEADQSVWSVQFAIHPQINLMNVTRNRYAQLNSDEFQCTEIEPWGQNCLITLEFVCGKYALKSADNRYIDRTGNLVPHSDAESRFTIELKSLGKNLSGIAFKDHEAGYLSAVGHTGIIKSKNKSACKDELFSVEESHPQVVFLASNGKAASIKLGLDVSANQSSEEHCDKDIFQMQYHKKSQKWTIFASNNKYWQLDSNSGVQAIGTGQANEKSLFDIKWQETGMAAILASNGRYVYNKENGALTAGSDVITPSTLFIIRVVNRPLLVLQCSFGYVGIRSGSESTTMEYICNKVNYDVITLEPAEKGLYYLKGPSMKYLHVTEDTVQGNSATPTLFVLEFRGQSVLSIRVLSTGMYLKGEKSGHIRPIGQDVAKATLWHY